MALAHLASELDRAGALRVAGVAHFNHQLRAAADQEERFCVEAADALGWPILVDREDVAGCARRERRSIEVAARAARHRFFERARGELGADRIAVGHTRDDQAETFLLRLVRGAGPRGLAAMHPRNGRIVRPLLACRRDELRDYLRVRGIGYVDDESNADVGIPRNRVRAELLPLLADRFNPRIVDVLAAEAARARDEWRWMEAAADELLAAATTAGTAAGGPCRWVFEADALRAMPPALRRVVLWRAMQEASGGRAIGGHHVEAAVDLVESATPRGAFDAPGQRVERVGSQVVLISRAPGTGRQQRGEISNLFRYSLSIPGEVSLPDGSVVGAEVAAGGDVPLPQPGPSGDIAVVRRDRCREPLAVRNRRPGDRFQPTGLDGRKKLQDLFVDRKIARDSRDRVPIVVDAADRIVWVAGHGVDAAFRVTDPAQPMLILIFKAVEASPSPRL